MRNVVRFGVPFTCIVLVLSLAGCTAFLGGHESPTPSTALDVMQAIVDGDSQTLSAAYGTDLGDDDVRVLRTDLFGQLGSLSLGSPAAVEVPGERSATRRVYRVTTGLVDDSAAGVIAAPTVVQSEFDVVFGLKSGRWVVTEIVRVDGVAP
ncbi:MAG: hypothetical protein CVT59_00985 [Actinobacteria bacterium HGW-Actinobacteria-1]|jgi:hypothetical protein|nr:MAG: hypothetical protein CVT59_00985 [Actinobacteria bacterium HGW-Actinobacteria-1]